MEFSWSDVGVVGSLLVVVVSGWGDQLKPRSVWCSVGAGYDGFDGGDAKGGMAELLGGFMVSGMACV